MVAEHRGRFGLPPVFLHSQWVSWVEIETGAELHVRLLLAHNELASPSRLERLVTRGRVGGSLHPSLVASYPVGDVVAAGTRPPPGPPPHPPGPPLGRRPPSSSPGSSTSSTPITPPLRGRLHVRRAVPAPRGPARPPAPWWPWPAWPSMPSAGASCAASAGPGGWPVVLLAGTILLHLVAGADVEESLIAGAVLAFLLVNRREFQAASDATSLRSALIALGRGGRRGGRGGHGRPSSCSPTSAATTTTPCRGGRTFWAVSERFVGITTIALPDRADRFLAPALLTIGLCLVAVTLYLLTRPVVDRRLGSGRAAEFRARDIVRRHGASTLDYFALRSDKQWFFHRDSLVAYAVYGGVCLISPDPIGPRNEREQVWGAFRRVRRHPRLDDRGHGGRRGLAPHLPRLGDAQHLPRRRGRGASSRSSAWPAST